MAAINYNEFTHTSGVDLDSMDPLYKWDTHFPERMSRLNMEELGPSSPGSKNARMKRRNRNRNSARFKTQPITFDEIKEVDEDRADEEAKKDLKNQFAAFSRSMDGILPVKKEGKGKKMVAPDPACFAAQAAGPPEEPPKVDPANMSASHGSEPAASSDPSASAAASSSSATTAGGIPLANLPQYDAARQARRQKRRHKKSITEVPEEGEKTNGEQTGTT